MKVTREYAEIIMQHKFKRLQRLGHEIDVLANNATPSKWFASASQNEAPKSFISLRKMVKEIGLIMEELVALSNCEKSNDDEQ